MNTEQTTTLPVSSAAIQAARDRMLATATGIAEGKLVPLPKLAARKAECATCRGKQYVWLLNPATVQKEIGDCPDCKPQRPVLPDNSHLIVPKTARFGHHKITKPRARG